MSALPADIARYTNDGIVLTNQDPALFAAHPESEDKLGEPIEMFFDTVADGQALLDEKFALLAAVNPVHEGIEVEESLRLGQDIALAPTVPCFRIVDAERGIDVVARTRAYAYEMASDRFSIEVVG